MRDFPTTTFLRVRVPRCLFARAGGKSAPAPQLHAIRRIGPLREGGLFITEDDLKMPNAANNSSPLGRIFSLEEAAAHLRVSRRALQEIIKRHPFYAKNGRVYLFSESDVLNIWEGMRFHSNSSAVRDQKSGTSVESYVVCLS